MKSQNKIKGNWMVAAAFAEAGEWETARSMMPDKSTTFEPSWFSRIFSAVAFAEEGLFEDAVRLAGGRAPQTVPVYDELEDLGLSIIHLRYGTVCFD